MAAKNFHATNAKSSYGVKGPPLFSCGWRLGVFFFKSCLVWRVDCSLSTWTVDFTYKLFVFVFGGGRAPPPSKQTVPKFLTCSPKEIPSFSHIPPKSSQVSDLFLKEFPIAPQIYHIFFGKCCPPFTYISGPKGKNSELQNRTFYVE